MTKEQTQIHLSQLNDQEISIQLLVGCVAVLEPKISKASYNMKRFKNAGEIHFSGSKHSFDLYIGMRNKIQQALRGVYTLDQLREKAKRVTRSDTPSLDIVNTVIQLLDDGRYLLVR